MLPLNTSITNRSKLPNYTYFFCLLFFFISFPNAFFLSYLQLERACSSDLWSFTVLITIGTILYLISGYLKACILCLKLNGPPATFFVGNIMALRDKDCKLKLFIVWRIGPVCRKTSRTLTTANGRLEIWHFITKFTTLLDGTSPTTHGNSVR